MTQTLTQGDNLINNNLRIVGLDNDDDGDGNSAKSDNNMDVEQVSNVLFHPI